MKLVIIIGVTILVALGAIWFITKSPAQNLESTNRWFSVNVLCEGKKTCLYRGRDIDINIILTNISTEPISIPAKLLEQRGPSITLINLDTQQKQVLRTQPSDQNLLTDLIRLEPGQTTRITWVIPASELRTVGGEAVNIQAWVSILSPVLVGGVSNDYTASSSIEIIH
ncbi:MAG TPA: hypothetical protein PKD79_00120 [Candidatus Doudnabacteria bacterium]|nr:hypothetical protein [Candidatus Doudnabacteria bacterium]